jgi:hypothetical protein
MTSVSLLKLRESEDRIVNQGNDPRLQLINIYIYVCIYIQYIYYRKPKIDRKKKVANPEIERKHIPSWKHVSVFLGVAIIVHIHILL